MKPLTGSHVMIAMAVLVHMLFMASPGIVHAADPLNTKAFAEISKKPLCILSDLEEPLCQVTFLHLMTTTFALTV